MKKAIPFWLYVFLSFIPIGISAYLFNKYAVNIPLWDDHAVRAFVPKFQSASFSEKLRLLTALHNEHRIAYTRLWAWLLTKLTGQLDFRHLMLVGHASLLLIWGLLTICIRNLKLSGLYVVVAATLLFSLATAENFYWGMAAVQNFGVIGWAMLCFAVLLLFRWPLSKWQALLAFCLAVVAFLTSSNGLLAFFIAAVILLAQRKYKWAVVWAMATSVVLGLHFYFYAERPDPVGETPLTIGLAIKGLLSLAGATTDAEWFFQHQAIRFAWTQLVGGLLLCLSLWMAIQVAAKVFKYNLLDNITRTKLFLLMSLLFIGGTMAGIVLSRYGLGLGVFLTSKYKIYSLLLLCILLIYIGSATSKTWQNKVQKIALVVAILVSLNAILVEYRYVRYQQMERTADLISWKLTASEANETFAPYPYQPAADLAPSRLNFSNLPVNIESLDSLSLTPTSLIVEEKDFEWNNHNQLFIVLHAPSGIIVKAILPNRNSSRWRLPLAYFQRGFKAEISRTNSQTDFYHIYLLHKKINGFELIDTGKIVRLNAVDAPPPPKVQSNW